MTEFERLKEEFLQDVVTTVEMKEIPSELILNWDQTGIKIVPSNTWTMEEQGSKRVDVAGANDKRQITAVFCGSLVGDFLTSPDHIPGQNPTLPSQVPVSTRLEHHTLSQTLVERGDDDRVCGGDNHPIHQDCMSFLQR